MKINRKYIVLIAVIIVFIALQLFLKSYISKQPEYREIMVANPFNTLPPAEYLGTYVSTVALGGFKPLLVDYLWMKQDKLQKDRQLEEIVLLLNIIARLQPRFTEVWSFNAYHMIYNISAQENTPQARWHWVKNGIDYIKEGMLHNPDNVNLTQWLAFFYYHRIPQDPYFMQQVESSEGSDSYDVASRWYQQAINLCKKQDNEGWAELYATMYSACRFRHSFELVRKDRFDDAVRELEYLSDSTREIMERERLKDLIQVVQYDKEVSKIRVDSPDFVSANSSLIGQYGDIINKNVGYDFAPINARVEFILSHFVSYAYRLIDEGRYSEAVGLIKLLRQATDKIMPKLDSHPAGWYYRSLLERFEKLEGLVNAESYFRREGVKDFRTDKRSAELKSLYEEYIRKYSSRWMLGDEKKRFNNLMGE
ncbi:MAG: hypothetical protein HZA49_07575 [Planctomycetes bacterium]|nr:hypothetical protein [Planctomycetota bacterium]